MMKFKITICLLAMLCFHSCSLLEDDGDGGGNSGGGNSDTTMELTRSNFQEDLILTDRNDGVDYIVTQAISIDNDLEIRPGVVIEFVENTSFDVRQSGTINAVGLENEPIVFTGEVKSKGAWTGIIIQSESLKNQFKHCEFSFAGGDGWGNNVAGALSTWASASLNVDNCVFRDNKNYGVYLYRSKDVELRSFENNSFENNDSEIILDPANVHELGRGNAFVGGDPTIDIHSGDVFVNGSNGSSVTWKSHEVPYRVLASTRVKGNNLTVEEGTRFLFEESAYFDVLGDASLTAIGTESDPILMSGVIDAVGSWPGISFQYTESSKNQLKWVEIENAGNGNDGFDSGVVYMWDSPKLTITNCVFRDNKGCIFNHASSADKNPNLIQEDNSFINSGSEFCN